MEPVNITFNINNDTLATQAQAAVRSIVGIGDSVVSESSRIDYAYKRAFDGGGDSIKELTQNITIQKQVVKDLEKAYQDTEKAIRKMPYSAQKIDLQNKLGSQKKEIEEETAAMSGLIDRQEQMKASYTSLRTQMAQVRDEMGRLKLAGKANSEEYIQLESELGRLGTAYRELQVEQNALSTGGTQMAGIISGVQGLTGAYAIGSGVVGMFTQDTEKLQQIQAKMQSTMAVLMGMQQVANTLHSTSAFRITTVRKVTQMWAAVNGTASASLVKMGLSANVANVASKALMATLTLGLTIAITAVIFAWNKYSDAQEAAKKKADELKQQQADIASQTAASMSKQALELKKLEEQWKKTTSDQTKRQFVKDNAKAFDELGVSINSVSDAENLLVTNKDAFIASMRAKAIAIAQMDMVSKKYAEKFEYEQEYNDHSDKLNQNKIDYGGNKDWERFDKELAIRFADLHKNELAKYDKEIDRLFSVSSSQLELAKKELEKAGISTSSNKMGDNKKQTPSTFKADAGLKASQAAAKKAIELAKAQEKAASDLASAARESEIANMQEGFAKKMAEIELEYDKQEALVLQRESEIIARQQETQKQEWLASGKKEDDYKASESPIPANISSYLDSLKTQNAEKKAASEKKLLDDLLAQYKDYTEQKKQIEASYNADIIQLQEKRNESNAAEIDRAIAEAEKLKSAELKSITEKQTSEAMKSSTLLVRLFSDAALLSVNEIKKIIKETEDLYEYLRNPPEGGFEAKFGFEASEITQMSKDAEKMKSILDGLISKKKELGNKSEIQSFAKSIGDAVSKINAGGAENIASGISDIGSSIGGIAPMMEKFGSDLGAIFGDEVGEYAQNIGELLGATAELGGGLAKIVSGDPQGIVEAVSGLAKIFTMVNSAKEAKKKAEEEIRQRQIDSELAELRINQLYRERYEWAKKIGEATLGYISRTGAELRQQTKDNLIDQKQAEDALRSLQFKNNEWHEKTGFMGWGKGKTVEEWLDIGDASWQQIDQWAEAGKLSEEGMKYYNSVKSAREENDALVKRQEEYLEEVRELYTGTTYNAVVNSIVDGFKNGKRSAADFADTFEQLMQNAIVSSLTMMAEDKVRKFYERFADLSSDKDGLTESDIAELNGIWGGIIDSLGKSAEDLERITGMQIGSDGKQQEADKGAFKSLSQEAGDVLMGQFTALRIHTADISGMVKAMQADSTLMYKTVEQIEKNTFKSADFLEKIDARLKRIEVEGIKI